LRCVVLFFGCLVLAGDTMYHGVMTF